MRVRHKPLLDLLNRCTSNRPRKQAKLKTPQRLQELLNICRELYSDSLKEGQKFAKVRSQDQWRTNFRSARRPRRRAGKNGRRSWSSGSRW